MAARLIDSLGTTESLSALFSDESLLQAMLDFEVALARAEARDIQRAATAQAMRTMREDALDKARAGLTTAEEVVRVTQED